jgi:hypothetical protein
MQVAYFVCRRKVLPYLPEGKKGFGVISVGGSKWKAEGRELPHIGIENAEEIVDDIYIHVLSDLLIMAVFKIVGSYKELYLHYCKAEGIFSSSGV